ncbi:IS110 family transposase [Rickettsia endosymbiont of Pantilius tunicatus]|uniref:IS110 family transposase n=1 Tax=Rickettsia endosymbiont of Pantilius tunicatus TaxID=3066267 RepID=UPI00376F4345
MTKNIFIGIDVSEDTLDIWLHPLNKYKVFDNNQKGINELVEYIADYNIAKIVIEATGRLEYEAANTLQKVGYLVSVVNPYFTSAFRTMRGKFTKTDTIDAQMLALFAEKMNPESRKVANEIEKELKELTARRNQLITMIVSERNRLRRVTNQKIINSINSVINLLNDQKEEVEKLILYHILNIESYKEIYNLLITIPDIGSIIAITLITELPELGNLNCKQIASLVGVAPHCKESGKTRFKAKTKGGRKTVRAALYMVAVTSVRCNPAVKPFYKRLVEKGKAKKLALTAIMRKIVIIVNNIVKNKRPWQNQYKIFS